MHYHSQQIRALRFFSYRDDLCEHRHQYSQFGLRWLRRARHQADWRSRPGRSCLLFLCFLEFLRQVYIIFSPLSPVLYHLFWYNQALLVSLKNKKTPPKFLKVAQVRIITATATEPLTTTTTTVCSATPTPYQSSPRRQLTPMKLRAKQRLFKTFRPLQSFRCSQLAFEWMLRE